MNAATGSDTGTCRLQSHPCQTISYALTQAPANATIKVAAGSYPQPLQITKPETIIGNADSGKSATVIDPATLISDTDTDTDTDSGTQQEVIVDVTNTTGVKLQKLAIKGGAAKADFTSCGEDFVGVYDKNGVTCDDAGTSCTLTDSRITGIGKIAQNGFQGYDAASVSLSDDTVSHNSYSGGGAGNAATGLLVYDVGAVSATGNSLSANDVNGYFGDDGTGPSAGTWTICGNTAVARPTTFRNTCHPAHDSSPSGLCG